MSLMPHMKPGHITSEQSHGFGDKGLNEWSWISQTLSHIVTVLQYGLTTKSQIWRKRLESFVSKLR